MKKLPTGLQVFEDIRKNYGLYVGKTNMIYNIISVLRSQYFITRLLIVRKASLSEGQTYA